MTNQAVKFFELDNLNFYRLPTPVSIAPDGWAFNPTRYVIVAESNMSRSVLRMEFNEGYGESDLINNVVGCINTYNPIHRSGVKSGEQLISELLAVN